MRSPIITQLEPRRLAKCYAALAQRLAGREWLLDSFSAVDVACGQALYMSQKFAQAEPFANVMGWLERIAERPAFQASLPKPGEALLYQRDFYEPLA
jgi:glutathione S-transferase